MCFHICTQLSKEIIVVLLRPFSRLLATTPDVALRSAINEAIFEPMAVAIETTATPKLSIDHIAMSTEFFNLAKDAELPRSTANRKWLYQLHERLAKYFIYCNIADHKLTVVLHIMKVMYISHRGTVCTYVCVYIYTHIYISRKMTGGIFVDSINK